MSERGDASEFVRAIEEAVDAYEDAVMRSYYGPAWREVRAQLETDERRRNPGWDANGSPVI